MSFSIIISKELNCIRQEPVALLISKEIKVGMIVGLYYAAKKNGKPDYRQISKHIRLAEKYAVKLWNEGFAVFTPHLNTRHFEVKTKVPEAIYQGFDQHILSKAVDFIFVLPNWRESKGGRKEVRLAIKLGIQVFDKISELKKWRKERKDYKIVKL